MFPIKNAVPTRYPPVVTVALIIVNCVAFLYELSLSPGELEAFLVRYALVPGQLFGPDGHAAAPSDYFPFLTMMFLHGGWLHLIFNMWTLWLFGGSVEDRLGHGRYLAFYFACGIVASAAHVTANPGSSVPALGASGAIAGVMGCYVRQFPLARLVVVFPILFFPFFFEMPAFVFVGFWFLIQVLQGTIALLTPAAAGDVAWWAYVGGFVVGLAVGPLMVRSERAYRRYYLDEGILGFDPSGR
jgi:rhomboid family protein